MSEWDVYNHRGGHVGIVQAENMAEALQRADERWPEDGGHVCVGRVRWPRKKPKADDLMTSPDIQDAGNGL